MHGPSPYAFIRQSGLNWGVRSGCACTVPASDHDEEMERRKAELLQHKAEAARKAEEEFAKQPKYIGTIDVHVGGFTVDPRTGSRHLVDHSVAAHGHDASHGSAGSGQVSHGHSQAPGQSEGAHSTAP